MDHFNVNQIIKTEMELKLDLNANIATAIYLAIIYGLKQKCTFVENVNARIG